METVQQKFKQQLTQNLPDLTTSQRLFLAMVAFVMIAGLLIWTRRDSTMGYTPLTFGKTMTTEEIIASEQAFQEAGLNDFQRKGQMIFVPTNDVSRYHGALVNLGALPTGFGDALEKQLEGGLGVFESSRTSQQRKDIALAKFLQQTLQSIPNIEFASVAWARSKASRWPHQGTGVTATVNVRPKRGIELSSIQITSFRTAVAAMVPDLTPANVTVYDMSTGVSHTPDDIDGALDNGLLNRIHDFTHEYETKISQALAYIPNVLVTVNVDVDELKSRVDRIQKIDSKGGVKIYESTATRNEEVQQQAPRAEPGVRNNQPASLKTAAGPTEIRKINEEDASSTSTPSFTQTEQEFFAAMPKSVQVSIKIPKDYYEAVAKDSGLVPEESANSDGSFQRAILEIEKKEIEKVRATASVLIPKGSDKSSIDVSSFHSVREGMDPTEPALWERAAEIGNQWGGKTGLFLFACASLWLVHKHLPVFQPNASAEAEEEEQELKRKEAKEELPEDPVIHKNTSTRDALQAVVRDNPDVTAGILEEWLDQVKT